MLRKKAEVSVKGLSELFLLKQLAAGEHHQPLPTLTLVSRSWTRPNAPSLPKDQMPR